MSKSKKQQTVTLSDWVGACGFKLSELGIAVDMAIASGKSAKELADIIKPILKEAQYMHQGMNCLLHGSFRDGSLIDLDLSNDE